MPCDIGYKEVARTVIPKPVINKFKAKIDPPKIDQDLLDKIGEEDEAFVNWINEMDILPILSEALKWTLAATAVPDKIKIKINGDGSLDIKSEYNGENERRRLAKYTERLSSRFQMEVLAAVAALLGYKTEISESDGELILEGEKHQHSHAHVSRYLKITKNGGGAGEFRFEHFASPEELKSEKQKFMALAQKFGVKVNLEIIQKSGQVISADTIHEHFLKNGG